MTSYYSLLEFLISAQTEYHVASLYGFLWYVKKERKLNNGENQYNVINGIF